MSEEREWILENCNLCGGVIRTSIYRRGKYTEYIVHKSCYDSIGNEE